MHTTISINRRSFTSRARAWIGRNDVWPWDRNKKPRLGKAEIINMLGAANGYGSYLEIATGVTGLKFSSISTQTFARCHRILYNIAETFSDGLPIHCRSSEQNAVSCLQELSAKGYTYDVILVDSYHLLDTSRLDIALAYTLLNAGGVLVVHDCNPPRYNLTPNQFQPGYWMGKSYLAFIEFVEKHPELEYCVIDTDWGVGLVFREDSNQPRRNSALPARVNLADYNYHEWPVFTRHRRALLRLLTLRQFRNTFLGNN